MVYDVRMSRHEEAKRYLATQQSLHLYKDARDAFFDVLSALPDHDFDTVTKDLTLMVLHEGAVAQVMHFEPTGDRFRVLQLTIPHDAPPAVLRWVIAHELGHVMQGRNWCEEDGESLEIDASERARTWGFEKTDEIGTYLYNYRARFQNGRG